MINNIFLLFLKLSLCSCFIFSWEIAVSSTESIKKESSDKKILEKLNSWRTTVEKGVKNNWVNLEGLFWLTKKYSHLGTHSRNEIQLPKSISKEEDFTIGQIANENGVYSIIPNKGLDSSNIRVNGEPIKIWPVVLKSDQEKDTTYITIGSVKFYLIKRGDKVGIRVSDTNSPRLKKFKGLSWWEYNKNFIITGKLVTLAEPVEIDFPDVIGNVRKEKVSKYVEFVIDGKTQKLYPTGLREDAAFFVFKDKTSGPLSYGAGRFVGAKINKENGEVVIDFNRANNPPCAQTPFATCPLPPKENTLTVAINAGEKKPLK